MAICSGSRQKVPSASPKAAIRVGIQSRPEFSSLPACRIYPQRTLVLLWSSFLLSYPLGIVVTGC